MPRVVQTQISLNYMMEILVVKRLLKAFTNGRIPYLSLQVLPSPVVLKTYGSFK